MRSAGTPSDAHHEAAWLRDASIHLTSLDQAWIEPSLACRATCSAAGCSDECEARMTAARMLPSLWEDGNFWHGARQGCPHAASTRTTKAERPLSTCAPQKLPAAAETFLRRDRGISTRPVLLILSGLWRAYREGLASIRRMLIDVNPDVAFEIAVLTNPLSSCSNKDHQVGECSNSTFPVRDGPLPSLPNFTSALSAVLAPLPLVYTQFTQWGGQKYDRPFSFHRLARGWAGLQSIGFAQRYAHVLYLRPDAELTRELPLREVCSRSPGLNVISGASRRGLQDEGTYFHHRDWDHGLLSCDPRALNRWLYPYINQSANCDDESGPPLPEYFTGAWPALFFPRNRTRHWRPAARPSYDRPCSSSPNGWRCMLGKSKECAAVELFERARAQHSTMRLGNLDRDGIFAKLLIRRSP